MSITILQDKLFICRADWNTQPNGEITKLTVECVNNNMSPRNFEVPVISSSAEAIRHALLSNKPLTLTITVDEPPIPSFSEIEDLRRRVKLLEEKYKYTGNVPYRTGK